jgi:hypothetical protein
MKDVATHRAKTELNSNLILCTQGAGHIKPAHLHFREGLQKLGTFFMVEPHKMAYVRSKSCVGLDKGTSITLRNGMDKHRTEHCSPHLDCGPLIMLTTRIQWPQQINNM